MNPTVDPPPPAVSSPRGPLRAALRAALVVAALLSLLPLIGLTELDLRVRVSASRSTFPDEHYNLPPAGLLRGLAFGYNELAADLIWVRAINYFVDQYFQRRSYRYLERYISTILALDHHFKAVYRYGPAMLVSKGPSVTNADVMAAIRLSKRAHHLYPDDWRFPLNIGSYYMFELRTESKEQKDAWLKLGADWTVRAALVGADIDWLPSLAAKIYTRQGRRELAIKHLQELYLANQDEGARRNILGKLVNLQAAQQAESLVEATAALEKEYKESPLRFVPLDLYILLRQPDLKPFSLKKTETTE